MQLLTSAQYRRLERSLAQLDGLATELDEKWDEYDFGDLASARSLIREWEGWGDRPDGGTS